MSEKVTAPQIVTANRLVDGAVVYLTVGGEWSVHLSDGAVWRTQEEADIALKASDVAVAAQIVVGPYLIEIAETPKGVQATSARERIRADRKPTFEPDAGSWTGRISA